MQNFFVRVSLFYVCFLVFDDRKEFGPFSFVSFLLLDASRCVTSMTFFTKGGVLWSFCGVFEIFGDVFWRISLDDFFG